MRFKQVNTNPLRKKYALYSPSSLTNAYMAVKNEKKSVQGAARQYGVPVTTLRDRVLGKIHPDTTSSGRSPIFSQLEESQIIDHVKIMSKYGYGYSRQETVDIASDYARQLNKIDKNKDLTLKWFRGFSKRWPEIRVLKARSLEEARAKCTSETKVSNYFDELNKTLIKHDLLDKPHLIFNIDEKGVSPNHKPPYVVCGSDCPPQAVTAGKSCTITVMGSGSASGMAIPPFFIFPGKRMMPDLLIGSVPGADGVVSESGWSNSEIFRLYLEKHFLKFAPVKDDQKVLIILDGHKSHATVGLVDWAKNKNIILFILPAHTSHILQPLDVGCYGPFEALYNSVCHKYTKLNKCSITRFNVCELVCKIYYKALSPENLQSAFCKTGIFPFNKDIINKDMLQPAKVFESQRCDTEVIESETGRVGEIEQREVSDSQQPGVSGESEDVVSNDQENVCHCESVGNLFKAREASLIKVKSEGKKTPRNTLGRIIAGHAITDDDVMEKMMEHERTQKKRKNESSKSEKGKKVQKKSVGQKKSVYQNKKTCSINKCSYTDSESDFSDIDEQELCCVCKRFSPMELRNSVSLVITKWAQCDVIVQGKPCNHWTHLIYCSPVRVLRRNESFQCPCHV